ncbi:hypothetical protein AXG93_3986s1130 [Marchantia polymorpha subsp. ruderalis]|uniref:Uncharacterized protein n=1 Tax=Marchantia polymorpha subsp. ruderalis TaxID=1480154 RepID=A0A176VQE2_MARPO|nr:hypothetical protein AXG93_3986s1130 [Marchantia polymorpha subsp. ruderalis]
MAARFKQLKESWLSPVIEYSHLCSDGVLVPDVDRPAFKSTHEGVQPPGESRPRFIYFIRISYSIQTDPTALSDSLPDIVGHRQSLGLWHPVTGAGQELEAHVQSKPHETVLRRWGIGGNHVAFRLEGQGEGRGRDEKTGWDGEGEGEGKGNEMRREEKSGAEQEQEKEQEQEQTRATGALPVGGDQRESDLRRAFRVWESTDGAWAGRERVQHSASNLQSCEWHVLGICVAIDFVFDCCSAFRISGLRGIWFEIGGICPVHVVVESAEGGGGGGGGGGGKAAGEEGVEDGIDAAGVEG